MMNYYSFISFLKYYNNNKYIIIILLYNIIILNINNIYIII